jgi:hypothetical protein
MLSVVEISSFQRLYFQEKKKKEDLEKIEEDAHEIVHIHKKNIYSYVRHRLIESKQTYIKIDK